MAGWKMERERMRMKRSRVRWLYQGVVVGEEEVEVGGLDGAWEWEWDLIEGTELGECGCLFGERGDG